ncbi:MAG: type II secretion system F family protein [Chloroflexota bacterium]
MAFEYVVYAPGKGMVKGAIDVASEDMAEETLEKAGYRVISLKPVKDGRRIRELFPTFFGVKSKDMLAFSGQLATLIESGIPLVTALHLLGEQVESKPLREVINGVIEELQGGKSFSQALASYPQVFPEIYRQIVAAGEHAGTLELGIRQAVNYIEKGAATLKKAKRALMYPAFVLVLAIGVIILLMTVALPPMLTMLTEFGAELPLPTRILLAVTGFLTAYKFYILGTVLGSVILMGWYVSRPAGRLALDKLMLKLPVAKSITIQSNMAMFSRTVSVLTQAGLPLPQIIDIVCQTTSNRIIREAIKIL